LACKDDTRRAPAESMVQPLRLAELFSVPRPAAVGSDERFGLTQLVWRRGLENASVPQDLSDLSEGRVFDLLRGLKDRKATDDVVRRLYQQVVNGGRISGHCGGVKAGQLARRRPLAKRAFQLAP
jgi:hypothetical protein